MKKRILVWPVHGNYLYYLTRMGHEFYVPVTGEGVGGRFEWGDNVHEVAREEVRELDLDLVIYQSPQNYFEDQYELLSTGQRELPKIYIEHDPPRRHPTDTKHWVDDDTTQVVQVTHYNALMWDMEDQPTTVIEHGVLLVNEPPYTGEKAKGVVVINNLDSRGRRLGRDVFLRVREEIPLDLIGMGSEVLGGVGEVSPRELPQVLSRYRFMFCPMRYTSLGLAAVEAMMGGLPVAGLATTELPSVIQDGVNGFVDTDLERLMEKMKTLLTDKNTALEMSKKIRNMAQKRFGIGRFVADWEKLIEKVINNDKPASPRWTPGEGGINRRYI